MAQRVRLNASGMRQLLKDPGVRAELHRRGERVANRARATAPFDSDPERPATYGDGSANVHFRDSFDVVDDTTDRAVCRIVTTDPKGAIKEARFRTLTSALDSAG